MKQLFFILVVLATSFSLFAQEANPDIVKETRTIKKFDKLKVSKGINVTLIKGLKPSAEINIVNAPPSDVIIENDQNELSLKMKTRIYKDMSVQVYVTYTDIREISAGSGATVDSEDVLTGNSLIINAGLDSGIDLEIDIESLEASVSAARVTLKGNTKKIEAKATTGGKFQGQNLKCQEAFVKANTGGIVTLNVSEYLDARAGTGGTVEYTGNPEKIETKETFGGSVLEI